MTRPLLIGLLCLCLSCNPTPPPQPTPPDIPLVRARALVNNYRDLSNVQADTNYTGRKIQVGFLAGDYEVFENQILWFSGLPKSQPVLVFLCSSPIKDNSKSITIIGVCKGKIIDGKKRGDGINWYIVIDECSVSSQ